MRLTDLETAWGDHARILQRHTLARHGSSRYLVSHAYIVYTCRRLIDLSLIAGQGGTEEQGKAFCEFVGIAGGAGIDLELYVDGWPGLGRPTWNAYSYAFVRNCTMTMHQVTEYLKSDDDSAAAFRFVATLHTPQVRNATID